MIRDLGISVANPDELHDRYETVIGKRFSATDSFNT